jgi:4-aminobutyrate aminotransferase-like enzyme
VLGVLQDEGLQARAARVGARLRRELTALAAVDPRIGDVRGAGLYLGVDVVTDPVSKTPDVATALDLVEALRDRRVLTSVCGPGNVLKLRPPLVFDDSDADRLLETFDDSLRSLPR